MHRGLHYTSCRFTVLSADGRKKYSLFYQCFSSQRITFCAVLLRDSISAIKFFFCIATHTHKEAEKKLAMIISQVIILTEPLLFAINLKQKLTNDFFFLFRLIFFFKFISNCYWHCSPYAYLQFEFLFFLQVSIARKKSIQQFLKII